MAAEGKAAWSTAQDAQSVGVPHVLRIVVPGLGDQRAAECQIGAVHEAGYYRTQSEAEEILPCPVKQAACALHGIAGNCGERSSTRS